MMNLFGTLRGNKKGDFSVKSTHHFATFPPSHFRPPTQTPFLGTKIMRFSIPHKIKHFIKKACNDAIPTKPNLILIDVDPLCPQCHGEVESASHCLLQCNFSNRCGWLLILLLDLIRI